MERAIAAAMALRISADLSGVAAGLGAVTGAGCAAAFSTSSSVTAPFGPLPEIVRAIKGAGIAVCCHLGLEPQNHEEKRLKGKTAAEARKLVEDSRALDEAGMDMLVLEVIPEDVAEVATKAIKAPTIGIGGGRRAGGR